MLVADDEVALLRAYERTLGRAGYVVEAVASGKEAIERFSRGNFDVILSDLAMPGMSGLQLIREIRQHDTDIPVVLITAGPSVGSAVEALECGAFRYLLKPVEADTLKQVIADAVHVHKSARLKRKALALLTETAENTANDRAGLESRFASALESMSIVYQPIIVWSKREVFGYEALLRSGEPSLLHAGAMIEAAEKLGRVFDLGRQIRHGVAEPIAGADRAPNLFVNLHPSDLMDEMLYLPDTPLARIAPRVVLEITERATLDEVKDVRSRVDLLRTMGYRIAVDDIGAGYAGLTSLTLLQPDVIKLDMALVRDVDKEPTKRKLVASMIRLCRDLNILVVAEGIETKDERDALVELGCDLLQGFLIARPGPPLPKVNW